MFRKLSIAALLVLATGAEAQKRVSQVDFCAVPTPEGSRLTVDLNGVFRLGGAIFGTAAGGDISQVNQGPNFDPVGTYMAPLRSGTCTNVGTGRIGTWQAICDTDFYEPVVQRLVDVPDPAVPLVYPTAAALQAACEAAPVPTAAQTDADAALCNSQISVTENNSGNKISKLGSSTWYNYVPTVTYTLIGGYMNQNFGGAGGNGPAARYCIYWPTSAASVGQPAGGTNKWAKPVIDTIDTALAPTNAPAGAARYADLNTATTAPKGLPKPGVVGPLTQPAYRETITVNYFKSYLPAGSL